MIYALAHKPDEFGLVPDKDGFVSVKELLQALHEEPEWGYVRKSHLQEAIIHSPTGLFDLEEKRIRTTNRHWKYEHLSPTPPPQKVLYTPIRSRAHRHVFENGLKPSGKEWVVLSTERDIAVRIGKRKDPQPVILDIMASAAYRNGTPLYRFGSLFLAKEISSEYISGPLPPKEDTRKYSETPRARQKEPLHLEAGTFFLDVHRDPDPMRRRKGRKPKGWKEEARKFRRKRKH